MSRQSHGGGDAATDASWRADDETNIRFYTERVRAYGLDIRSVDWGSRESQARRFSVLAELEDLQGRSVLDVGCGTGDLLAWLRAAGLSVSYTGLDITAAMVDASRARFPDAAFAIGDLHDPPPDLAAQYDVVVASGIFAYRRHDAEAYIASTVSRMFARCRIAAMFNALSAWAVEPDETDTLVEPGWALGMCRTMTPRLAFRHDYLPNDFTVALYRAPWER
jgi:SAM-dependent methyltransferase